MILLAFVLIGLGLSLIGGVFFADSGSMYGSSPSPAGPGPTPTVKYVTSIVPSFYAVSNTPETVVLNGGSYAGATEVNTGDFLIVQIAYSEGSSGNLPDVTSVRDTLSSGYSREASASPGVGYNFWEQVWAGRSSSTSSSTNVTVTPGWSSCPAPCVSSIIITMNIARYRNVAMVGSSIIIAPAVSSTSQIARIIVNQPGSILVELLSHGAYNDCQMDAARPSSGQTLMSCFTGTTERTELFDHSVSSAQTCNESYVWSQVEVQRGIYLELQGNIAE